MAIRRSEASRVRVSPIYARIGPRPSQAAQVAGSVAGGARLEREWRAWRAQFGDLWDANVEGTPPPPHAELFRYAV